MESLEKFKKGLDDPRRVICKMNTLLTRWKTDVPYNSEGIDVFSEDWDNLIILDACRFDEFKQTADLSGETDYRISRGSSSSEFIRGNFEDKTLHDLVYVSSNRHYAKLRDEINAEIYRYKPVELDAPDVESSLPHTVTKAALGAAEKYPKKRLMVHYMQPHQPFFGPKYEHLENGPHIWDTIKMNDMSEDEIIAAYRDNLRYVLEDVETLMGKLQGKTVISSDHGELLGERQRPIPKRMFGHSPATYSEKLVKVPWHVYINGPRRDIIAEKPEERTEVAKEKVKEELRSLGYLV